MPDLKEHDAMRCRASEGYPCVDCGTFLCLMCHFKGIDRCTECQRKAGEGAGS